MKGQGNQVSNGPKDHVSEHEDFDSWRNQHHQGYNPPMSTSMASDPYLSSYYGTSFPYQAFGVGDGTWSNGDPMTFLGGYGGQMGHHDSYNLDGMFGGGGGAAAAAAAAAASGGFGGFNHQPAAAAAAAAAAAGFNYGFHGNGGDYSTWGSSSMVRKPYDDYYARDGAGGGGGGGGGGGSGGAGGGVGGGMYGVEEVARGGGAGTGVGGALKAVEQGMQGLGLGEKDKDKEKVEAVGVSAPKKMTWASIASQPAKPQPVLKKKTGGGIPPPPMLPGKHNLDIGTWEGKNGGGGVGVSGVGGVGVGMGGVGGVVGAKAVAPPALAGPPRPAWGAPRGRAAAAAVAAAAAAGHHPQHHPQHHPGHLQQQQQQQQQQVIGGLAQVQGPPQPHHYAQQHAPSNAAMTVSLPPPPPPSHPVLDDLRIRNNYNPCDFELTAKGARFFVIKSYSEDDIHRSIKYEIWCSTEHGNKRLDAAFREREAKGGGPVFLFFSVNGSGHFCGMAQMTSAVDHESCSSVWSQDKWKGQFKVRWVYVKDVPNAQLRHIRLENNENKPVTNSRDTQEVPYEKGKQVLRIMHQFRHSTSIFDDFVHYEKRQEEEDQRKASQIAAVGGGVAIGGGGGGSAPPPQSMGGGGGGGGGPPPMPSIKDREGGRGRGGRGSRN